ncbi:hypothetical protein P3X46_013935 [Hevea brasiliensis]|uniref:Uncharacterized protein n=1 Tax=Hevea brasiliensis TaxID=3981 RepID=A0ABQ9M534_HEVBR|nr:uncharacterized protein LOC110658356 isoform X1 [Hevea brasiliensis]KAJ9175372.1 hypothetical protein P3X46_013935 [Hevea brasiliensis]
MGDEKKKKKIGSNQEEAEASKSNLFSVFPNIELKKFPPVFNIDPRADDEVAPGKKEKTSAQKPEVVRLADLKTVIPPPLKLQYDESGMLSQPLIVFPIYVLGGFVILKWVWARWKERTERGKKASSDDDQSSDEYQSPPDDHE